MIAGAFRGGPNEADAAVDDTQRQAVDLVGRVLVEGSHHLEAGLLHDPPRGDVDHHRLGEVPPAPSSANAVSINAREPSVAYPLPQASRGAGSRVPARRAARRPELGAGGTSRGTLSFVFSTAAQKP